MDNTELLKALEIAENMLLKWNIESNKLFADEDATDHYNYWNEKCQELRKKLNNAIA